MDNGLIHPVRRVRNDDRRDDLGAALEISRDQDGRWQSFEPDFKVSLISENVWMHKNLER